MKRGTTPIIELEVNRDLHDWHLYVTIVNGAKSITFENDDLTLTYENNVTKVLLMLTQEQTLSFKANTKCEVEIRAFKDNIAIATDIETIDVERILKDGVIGGLQN